MMENDIAALQQLNQDIAKAETAGDKIVLGKIVAKKLAFRRANGEIIDKENFIEAASQSDKRECLTESIQLFGDRAVVSCIVTVKTENENKKYHNLRLFVRQENKWKVLGWANQEM